MRVYALIAGNGLQGIYPLVYLERKHADSYRGVVTLPEDSEDPSQMCLFHTSFSSTPLCRCGLRLKIHVLLCKHLLYRYNEKKRSVHYELYAHASYKILNAIMAEPLDDFKKYFLWILTQ